MSPWDFFHINSIDKNSDGDYLVSARHTSTLYRINGSTGEIVWRCGGKLSDFDLLNGLNWSNQHDARWLSQNASTEVISFFDNASNGFQTSANHSQGYIIQINHDAQPPNVELLRSYPAPNDQVISASQGNLQIFDTDDYLNSNVFVSWGSQPVVTEHDSEGNILFRANVALSGLLNYRAYKFNVTLTPEDAPALYTYARTTDSDTVYYMSWNGATEVQSYNIYGRSGCDSDYTLVGNVTKTGFETNFTASGFQEFGMVEALDANGTAIRNSTSRGIKAFVPSQALSENCDDDACQVVDQYVVPAASVSVAETRSACAAQPVQTAQDSLLNSTSSGSSSSSSSSEGNAGSTNKPAIMSVAFMGLMSVVLILAVL